MTIWAPSGITTKIGISTGSDNSAPENDNAGTAKGNGGKGFEYPGLSNTNTGSGTPDISGDSSDASDNFEYGDDSVAGEYDVRESPIFNYGGGSIQKSGLYDEMTLTEDDSYTNAYEEGSDAAKIIYQAKNQFL